MQFDPEIFDGAVFRCGYSPAFLSRLEAKRRKQRDSRRMAEMAKARAERRQREKDEHATRCQIAAERALNERLERMARENKMRAELRSQIEIENAAQDADNRYRITMTEIIARMCWVFKVTPDELRGPSRIAKLVRARQAVCYWTYRLTPLSLPVIGKKLGGRDHATVHHSINTYRNKRAKMGRTLRKAR